MSMTSEQRIDNLLFLARFCDSTLTRDDVTVVDDLYYVRDQVSADFLAAHSRVVPDPPIPAALLSEVERIVALGAQRGVEVNRDYFCAPDGHTLLLDYTDPEERIEEMVEEARTH